VRGSFAYADDIALLAPTARAIRELLNICDDFATKFDVVLMHLNVNV